MISAGFLTDLLSGQRDYMLFLHGFCFFLLALVCLDLKASRHKGQPWVWMA